MTAEAKANVACIAIQHVVHRLDSAKECAKHPKLRKRFALANKTKTATTPLRVVPDASVTNETSCLARMMRIAAEAASVWAIQESGCAKSEHLVGRTKTVSMATFAANKAAAISHQVDVQDSAKQEAPVRMM